MAISETSDRSPDLLPDAISVALRFKSPGHEGWYYYYLAGMIGTLLVVYLFMRDTKADSAMHRHE